MLPLSAFFSDEDKSADVTPISGVVQEVNIEFNQRIEDIKQAHSYVDSVEIHYPGSADNIRVDNWMDVVTIDTTRIDLIKAVFWDMNSIAYEIETIEHTETETIVHEDGTTSVETTTTYEYILYITITSKTAEQQAEEYGFTDRQRDMLAGMLSGEFQPLMFALLGMDGDIGLTPEQLQNLYNDLPEGELGAEILRLAFPGWATRTASRRPDRAATPIAAILPNSVTRKWAYPSPARHQRKGNTAWTTALLYPPMTLCRATLFSSPTTPTGGL